MPMPSTFDAYDDGIGRAIDTNADGSVTVGYVMRGQLIVFPGSSNDNPRIPVRWVVGQPIEELDFIEDPNTNDGYNELNAINSDGTVIVGGSGILGGIAWIWDEAHGVRELRDVLDQAGADMTGWELWGAVDISGDGKVVIGVGTYNLRPIGLFAWLP